MESLFHWPYTEFIAKIIFHSHAFFFGVVTHRFMVQPWTTIRRKKKGCRPKETNLREYLLILYSGMWKMMEPRAAGHLMESKKVFEWFEYTINKTNDRKKRKTKMEQRQNTLHNNGCLSQEPKSDWLSCSDDGNVISVKGIILFSEKREEKNGIHQF